MNKRAQIIRMIILAILLGISVYILIKTHDSNNTAQDQTQTTAASSTAVTEVIKTDVTTSKTTGHTTQTSTRTTDVTTTQTEQGTTTTTTTTETQTQTISETTTQMQTTTVTTAPTSVMTTTTQAVTRPTQTTTTAQSTTETTKPAVFFGPYELNDISKYDIIDPNNDYTGNGGVTDNFDLSSVGRGIIRVHYTGEGDYKVRIEKDGEAYNYDLTPNGTIEVFPLQLGSGSYRALILRRIVDTRFSVVKSVSFNADINDQNLIYINSIQIVHWLPQMLPLTYARETLISDILTNGKVQKSELGIESFKLIWSYILSNISYDKVKYSNIANLTGYVPSIPATFSEKKGICYDYAAFMAGILRSFGIPVKLVTGYCPTYYGDNYHAWNEVFIDGRWILVDPTYDAAFFQAGHRVEFEKKKSLYTVSKRY